MTTQAHAQGQEQGHDPNPNGSNLNPNDPGEEFDPYSDPEVVRHAEREAMRKGWRPKDKFAGEPDDWVDAKTFLERGERFNKNLQAQVKTLETELTRVRAAASDMAKMQKVQLQEKDTQLKEALTALKAQRNSAVRDGEDDHANELETQIDQLKEQQAQVRAEIKAKDVTPETTAEGPAAPNPNDPVLLDWIDDGNAWFREDETLQKWAIDYGNTLRQQGTAVRGRKFLDLVTEGVKENFPRRFRTASEKGEPKPRVGGSGSNSNGNTSTARVGGKTKNDLPAADRALMEEFVAQGMYTEEAFLKSYFGRD